MEDLDERGSDGDNKYQGEERILGRSNVDNMEEYQDNGKSLSDIDNNTHEPSNVDNMKYQAEDFNVISTIRSRKPTARQSQNTKREVREIEMERKIQKSLKIKEATAKQELEAEKNSRRHKYVPSVEASTRQRRAYPIAEGEASGSQGEATVKDEQIFADFRNAKLEYFQKKKAHNDSKINSIKKTVSEIESEKRKELSKKNFAQLTEDAEAHRLELLRRQKENAEKQAELKLSDYKNIVRESRRAEHRQLNKAVEEHNKALQTQHKEASSVAASQYQDKVAQREYQWQRESQARAERDLERQKRREERFNRLKQENKQKKELQNSHLLQLDMHEKDESSWNHIYEMRVEEENIHFPRAVQDERVINVIAKIDESGSDEEVDQREAQRQRKEKQVTHKEREIDREVQEAKRVVTDKVLYRAKVQRKNIQ